jgi:DNA-directed RNA polymerase I, II, and III subunit RPABC1
MLIDSRMSRDYVDEIYKMRFTIKEMIEDRGFPGESINTSLSKDELKVLVDDFVNNDTVFDVLVENEKRKLYVKCFYNINPERSDMILTRVNELIMRMNEMDKRDDIIFIICDPSLEKLTESMKEWSKKQENNSLFHYKHLIYNFSRHEMVPKHIKLTRTEANKVKTEYRLQSMIQFPGIEKMDAMARYLGLRRGDLVRIERATREGFLHVVYRVCL